MIKIQPYIYRYIFIYMKPKRVTLKK